MTKLRRLEADDCPLIPCLDNLSPSDLSTHVYSLPVEALPWFCVLVERLKIKVVQDVSPHADGVCIVLEFPHYSTWLNFRDITKPKGVKWLNAWDRQYAN